MLVRGVFCYSNKKVRSSNKTKYIFAGMFYWYENKHCGRSMIYATETNRLIIYPSIAVIACRGSKLPGGGRGTPIYGLYR